MKMNIAALPKAVPDRPFKTREAMLRLVFDCFDAQTENVVALQVGANDGRMDDPIFKYLTQSDWKGVLVEPHPAYFSDLEKTHKGNPNVALVHAAVGETPGKLVLYHIDENEREACPQWLRGCASMERERLIYAVNRANRRAKLSLSERITTNTEVVATRLDSILEEHDVKPNLLLVDVEGHELPVMKSFDIGNHDFKLVVIEQNSGRAEERRELVELLSNAGFICCIVGVEVIAFKQGEFQIPMEAMLHFNGFEVHAS